MYRFIQNTNKIKYDSSFIIIDKLVLAKNFCHLPDTSTRSI